MALKLIITTKSAATDATQYLKTAALAGNYKQCSRTLSFDILCPRMGGGIPVLKCPVGSGIKFYDGTALLFDGFVFSSNDDDTSPSLTLTAYDRGIYLRRNETTLAANGTPENITYSLCSKFGIPAGDIAATGITVKRNFLPSSGGANNLYSIIQTLYTQAGKTNGKKYTIRFEGPALCVREKAVSSYSLLLKYGSNLLNKIVTESIENTVTRVLVYDRDNTLLATRTDDEMLRTYGLLQSVLVRSSDSDSTAQEMAESEMEDNGVERKITVNNLGDSSLMAGDTVALYSGGDTGVFWIDEDYHYWQDGKYTNKLVLNYRCLMAEGTSGAEA